MKLPFPPFTLLLLATAGCINSPDTEAKRAEQMIQLSEALNEVRSTAADLNQTLDSIKVVLARKLRGRAIVRVGILPADRGNHGTSMSTKVSEETRIGQPRSRARTATGSPGRTRSWRIPRRAMMSRQPGRTPSTVE